MEKRRDWKRPVLALAALGALTVAALAAPAGAHFRPRDEKKHVKKIARRIAKKEATTIVQTTVGPTLFVEETELDRFGPVNLSVGGTQTLGTWGPFSLVAECSDPVADADLDVFGEVFVRTTEANSVFASLNDSGDFGPGDNDEVWADSGATADIDPGDAPFAGSYDETSYAAAPSGAHIWGVVNASTNLGGAHCTFTGFTLSVAPNA
jgi:hypothetical protein